MKRRVMVCLSALGFALVNFSVSFADEFAADSIVKVAKRVATYHMKAGPIYPNTWDGGAYCTGIMAMHRLTKDTAYSNFATKWAAKWKWMPAVKLLTALADDICCCQTYCELYMNNPGPQSDSMIANTRTNLDSLFLVNKKPLWDWADAMYMAPPAVSRYCKAIKNNAYIDSMNRYYWAVSKNLYDTTYHLWYRDGGAKNKPAANGKPEFWSCGVAWVFGGITRVLQDMPLSHPSRPQWVKQFQEMAAAIKAAQGFTTACPGLWTTSMCDHTQWPDPESSGSAFFCFGMTWGINNKILDSAQYIDCVRKAWKDLVANVGSDGRLQRCENVDVKPASINIGNSSVEGEGAFMQAAEQLHELVTGIKTAVSRSGAKEKMSFAKGKARVEIGGFSGVNSPAGGAAYTLAGRRIAQGGGKAATMTEYPAPRVVVPQVKSGATDSR
jgi:unsaturated rhamnogalacturonyl hydrolase